MKNRSSLLLLSLGCLAPALVTGCAGIKRPSPELFHATAPEWAPEEKPSQAIQVLDWIAGAAVYHDHP